ncbi:MAG TPA: YafY family protein [Acidimicrobiales bacterium]|jgi:predicted DNA-binding transcriptional regulator YafY|nr:YafY family protein [Acidimicrobiales bacterium]
MRADRLVAIVLLLQAHGQMTVGDMAERLEVSERTIRRDLEGLSGAGVPVYAQRGRGGGWALLGGHRIDLSGLTSEEAQALFLVAGPNALAGIGVGPGVKSALRKLLAALPAPFREQAAAAEHAVLVDPDRWGRRRPPGGDQPAQLASLRDAVLRGRQVEMTYAKPGEEAATRRVHPYGLVSKSGIWYLLAGGSAGLRTFRVSRVRGVEVTDEPVERPEDFDLAEAWESVQSGFPARTQRGGVTVRLAVDPSSVRFVVAFLGSWANLQPLPGSLSARGWQHYEATFTNQQVAAAELVRFGAGIEVEAPDEVREALAEWGEALVATYGVRPTARLAGR